MVSSTTEPISKIEASKKQNIVYTGFDVDDTQYHGPALGKHTGEVIDSRCRATLKGLLGKPNKLSFFKEVNRKFGQELLLLIEDVSRLGPY